MATNVERRSIVKTVPAINTTYPIKLPPGAYDMAIDIVSPGVAKADVATLKLKPYVDKAQTQVGPDAYSVVSAKGIIATTITITTAAANYHFQLYGEKDAAQHLQPVVISHGLAAVLVVGSYAGVVVPAILTAISR